MINRPALGNGGIPKAWGAVQRISFTIRTFGSDANFMER
jgi:hypothetical protein